MRALGLGIVLLAAAAAAQVVPEREMEIVQSLYETGRYAEAARRATESLALANFTEPQRIKLHEIVGLSAFNLNDLKGAQAAFLQLLKLNPDHILDPFAVPPPAIRVFDQVRRDNVDALNLIRQQLALRAEQERRAAEERARLQLEEEERRRAAEAKAAEVVVRTVTKQSLLLNFVPFGAGQFQQGRVGWGVGLAVSEGVMAVLSMVAYLAIEALFVETQVSLPDRLTPDGSPYVITVRQIPESRRGERDAWTGVKYGTGAAFYALWITGIVEALFHHRDELVTEQKVPAANTPSPKTGLLEQPRLRLTPLTGGLSVGLAVHF